MSGEVERADVASKSKARGSWKCGECYTWLTSAYKSDEVEISGWPYEETILRCMTCKWKEHKHQCNAIGLNCLKCLRGPVCQVHQDANATADARKLMATMRKQEGISVNAPVTNDEDDMWEVLKQGFIKKYEAERRKPSSKRIHARLKKNKMVISIFKIDSYEEAQNEKRKRKIVEMDDGKKAMAADTFKGRTRKCPGCQA